MKVRARHTRPVSIHGCGGIRWAWVCCLLLIGAQEGVAESRSPARQGDGSSTSEIDRFLADLELLREAREAERRIFGWKDRLVGLDRSGLEALLAEALVGRMARVPGVEARPSDADRVRRILVDLLLDGSADSSGPSPVGDWAEAAWGTVLKELSIPEAVGSESNSTEGVDSSWRGMVQALAEEILRQGMSGATPSSSDPAFAAASISGPPPESALDSSSLLSPLALPLSGGFGAASCCGPLGGVGWGALEVSGPEVSIQAEIEGERWRLIGTFGWGSKRIVRH